MLLRYFRLSIDTFIPVRSCITPEVLCPWHFLTFGVLGSCVFGLHGPLTLDFSAICGFETARPVEFRFYSANFSPRHANWLTVGVRNAHCARVFSTSGVWPFPPGCLPAVLPVAFGGPTSPGLDSMAPGRSPPGLDAPNIINPGFAFRPRGKSGCAPVRTNSLSRPIAFHCPPPWMATPLRAPRSFFSPPGRSKARYAHGL